MTDRWTNTWRLVLTDQYGTPWEGQEAIVVRTDVDRVAAGETNLREITFPASYRNITVYGAVYRGPDGEYGDRFYFDVRRSLGPGVASIFPEASVHPTPRRYPHRFLSMMAGGS